MARPGSDEVKVRIGSWLPCPRFADAAGQRDLLAAMSM
jgi:hypothetical protein